MSVSDRALAASKKARHDVLCATIKTEVPRFLAVGEMLIELRELGVYKETHKTFASFINEAFGMEKSRAYQLIDACELRQDLSTTVDKKDIPTNEAQIRQLAKAPKEKRAEVVQIANEVAKSEDRKPTASDYRNAVEIVTAEPKRKEPEPEPEAEDSPADLVAPLRAMGANLDKIKRDCLALAQQTGGEWMPIVEIERMLKAIKHQVVTAAWEADCCEDKDCTRCAGRGWYPIARGKL